MTALRNDEENSVIRKFQETSCSPRRKRLAGMFGGSLRAHGRNLLKTWQSQLDELSFWVTILNCVFLLHPSGVAITTLLFLKEWRIWNMSPECWLLTVSR